MTDAFERHKDQNSGQHPVTLPPTLFLSRKLLFNREASWLEFNSRVLEEALDQSQPLWNASSSCLFFRRTLTSSL
jgi:hypothetical protein